MWTQDGSTGIVSIRYKERSATSKNRSVVEESGRSHKRSKTHRARNGCTLISRPKYI